MSYTIMIDGGQGGETTVQADNLAEAVEYGTQWAKDGTWAVECDVTVTVSGPDGSEDVSVPVRPNDDFARNYRS